jgi:sensor c-di-GMP phosphodiesterase-like protein
MPRFSTSVTVACITASTSGFCSTSATNERSTLITSNEGLEHASQVAVLQSVGCGYAQGWYFSPPIPGDAFLQVARRAGRAGVEVA